MKISKWKLVFSVTIRLIQKRGCFRKLTVYIFSNLKLAALLDSFLSRCKYYCQNAAFPSTSYRFYKVAILFTRLCVLFLKNVQNNLLKSKERVKVSEKTIYVWSLISFDFEITLDFEIERNQWPYIYSFFWYFNSFLTF